MPQSTQRIGNREKTIIHVAKARMGLDDTTYRDILRNHGKVESSLALDWRGYQAVMRRFKELGFSIRHKKSEKSAESAAKKYDDLGQRPGMASPAMLRKIEAMWRDVARVPTDAALRIFLMQRFGAGDLRFLSAAIAWRVVEALKKMQSRSPITDNRSPSDNGQR